MTLMCQQNSYMQEFETKVKSCIPKSTALVENGKKRTVQGFDIILEDTILFPEGGGQPDDRGTLNGISVLRITRTGRDAVHFVESEIPDNTVVALKLDWERRFDHMQQHTAQHLITAVTDHKFSYKTTSWNIGTDIVTVELDTPTITDEQLQDIEISANESIRNNVPVVLTVFADKSDPELLKFRRLGLPADHEGPVRVMTIEGIDSTLCCGTHISNLSQIQAIKVLGAEKGKKNKMNLLFLAGSRLLKYVGQSFNREKTLTGILKGPAENHSELADKAVKTLKGLQKSCNTQIKEIATLETTMFKQTLPRDIVFVKHRKEGDNDYISVLLAELEKENIPKLVTVGEDKEGGMFVLAGSDEMLKAIGKQICDLFEGKGAQSKGVFRGKATQLTNRSKAELLLRQYVQNHTKTDKED
uniref:Threonyl/alanyl tRNA synthetase SAD domain-containing protein n=1 Tax=Arion vulgaris TaxID=1028688 RepID=A0A0B7API4_9EUPU